MGIRRSCGTPNGGLVREVVHAQNDEALVAAKAHGERLSGMHDGVGRQFADDQPDVVDEVWQVMFGQAPADELASASGTRGIWRQQGLMGPDGLAHGRLPLVCAWRRT